MTNEAVRDFIETMKQFDVEITLDMPFEVGAFLAMNAMAKRILEIT
jgi:hypothetical protein